MLWLVLTSDFNDKYRSFQGVVRRAALQGLMSRDPREMAGQAQAVPSLTKAQSYSTWTRQAEHV